MVSPYYQDDWVTIYHGDARELLPELRADVILTDYPYGVGIEYGLYSDSPENLDRLIRDTLTPMRGAAPLLALTCGIGNWWRFPEPTWVLCWYMANAAGTTGRWGFNQWQPVLVYGPDPYLRLQKGRRPDLVITAAPNNGSDKLLGHPCPKPIEAWRKILLRVSPLESDTILDPFVGSGSTLAAAKYTGRKSIGIDIEERFCEIAARRCAQEVLDLRSVV